MIIAAVNNDDKEAELWIPVPVQAREAVLLLEGSEESLPIIDGKIHIKIKGNWGAVLMIKGEN